MSRALKFFAVPLCGGIGFGLVNSAMNNFEFLAFGRFLFFGSVLSIVFGIPALWLVERFFYNFRLKYLLAGLLCGLLFCSVFKSHTLSDLIEYGLSGLLSGLLFTLLVGLAPYLPAENEKVRAHKILALPVSGGLVLGGVMTVLVKEPNLFQTFWIFFLIGGFLSVMFGWPLLLLLERFFVSRWRYVIGGAACGVFIWFFLGTSSFDIDWDESRYLEFWVVNAARGLPLCFLIGVTAGAVYTLIVYAFEKLSLTRK